MLLEPQGTWDWLYTLLVELANTRQSARTRQRIAMYRVCRDHQRQIFDAHGAVVEPLFASYLPAAQRLKVKAIEAIVLDLVLKEPAFFHSRVRNDLAAFKQEADVIIVNRRAGAQVNVADKVYTWDLFGGFLKGV